MKWLVASAIVVLLASCGHETPSYDSKYSTPASSSIAPASTAPWPVTPQLPVEASFVDTFDRPDTQSGLGEGWEMRGERVDSTVEAATDGFIRDGHYTYAGDRVALAERLLRGTVHGVGTVGRFRRSRPGGEETSFAMGIATNDKHTDVVLFTAKRTGWTLRMERDGKGLQPIMRGTFSPELAVDVDYQFEFNITGDTIRVRVPGSEVTRELPIADVLGSRVFWQEYVAKPPASIVFDFDTVWAVEDGQPLVSVSQ